MITRFISLNHNIFKETILYHIPSKRIVVVCRLKITKKWLIFIVLYMGLCFTILSIAHNNITSIRVLALFYIVYGWVMAFIFAFVLNRIPNKSLNVVDSHISKTDLEIYLYIAVKETKNFIRNILYLYFMVFIIYLLVFANMANIVLIILIEFFSIVLPFIIISVSPRKSMNAYKYISANIDSVLANSYPEKIIPNCKSKLELRVINELE